MFVVLLMMLHPNQELEPPANPERFSPTGSLLLIPQGTRIIGEYDNGVSFGQRRVLLVWNRLIFPNGRSIVLERLRGTDAAGYAGLEDGVDRKRYKGPPRVRTH